MLEMDVLYHLDYQYVTNKLFLRIQKNNHFDPVSKAYLHCKCNTFHCKTNTINL